jgi:hypothetical protein
VPNNYSPTPLRPTYTLIIPPSHRADHERRGFESGSGGLWLGVVDPKPHARLQSGLYSIAPGSNLPDGGLAHKIPNRGQDHCSPRGYKDKI